MADLNAILDSIKELKLLEVAELVKMMEDEFGVSAAAPVMVAGAADGAAAGAGGGNVPLQLHPQLLQRRPADHVPPLFVHHRSAQNVHRRNEPEDRRQPQRGSAPDGGAVLR